MRVLVLEDDPFHYEMLRDACEGRVQLQRVMELSDALEAARREHFDVLLLDLHVPDSSGIGTLEKALHECIDLPIVVLTTIDDEALGNQCVRLGAQDYLVKGREPTLGDHILRSIRHAAERQAARLELDRERQRREALKDEFLSHVSHELRTPLSAVHQFATILLARIPGELNEAQQEYLEIIVRNSKQLAKMIDDILEVARSDMHKLRIQLRPCEVQPIISEVLDRLRPEIAGKKLSLSSAVDVDVPQIHADSDRVAQVLSNLVENAIKFTPAKGSIALRVRSDNGGKDARFEVSDTGCGVSPENGERIFERMHQDSNGLGLSRKGLGLGLYICRELVTRHGGRIWLDRSSEAGSTLCFTIPSFDLPRLLKAKIVCDDALRKDLTLISLRIDMGIVPGRGVIGDRPSDALSDLVERTIYPDRDLLVPCPAGAGCEDSVVVLASTDRSGATALCARLRAAIGVHEELADLEGLLQVSQVEIDVSEELRALPLDQAIAEIARRVAEAGRPA